MNPAIQHIIQFFAYEHLPVHLQKISKPFHDLAWDLTGLCPENPELSVALRKLLESKDAAVRAVVAGELKFPTGGVVK